MKKFGFLLLLVLIGSLVSPIVPVSAAKDYTIRVYNDGFGSGGKVKVVLYDSSWNPITSKYSYVGSQDYTDVTFYLDDGDYNFEVYYTPNGGLEEYWGAKSFSVCSSFWCGSSTDFHRNWPYENGWGWKYFDSNHDSISTSITIKVPGDAPASSFSVYYKIEAKNTNTGKTITDRSADYDISKGTTKEIRDPYTKLGEAGTYQLKYYIYAKASWGNSYVLVDQVDAGTVTVPEVVKAHIVSYHFDDGDLTYQDSGTATVKVKNTGNVRTTFSVSLKYYKSGASSRYTVNTKTVTLDPEQTSSTLSFTYTWEELYNHGGAGTYKMYFEVTKYGSSTVLEKSDEASITVEAPRIDADIVYFDVTDSILTPPDDDGSVRVKIKNTGDVRETFKIRISVEKPNGYWSNGYFDDKTITLDPDETSSYLYFDYDYKSLKSFGGVGRYGFKAYVYDSNGNTVATSDVVYVTLKDYPDLTVTSVRLYKNGQEISEVYPGDQVDVRVTVKNNGDDSSSTYIGLYLSENEYEHSSSDYIDKIYLSGLSKGETKTVSKTITIPNRSPGEYYLNAFVDYQNQIAESNENNNIGYVPVTVKSNTLTVTVNVHNAQGLKLPGAGGKITLKIYDSSNTKIDELAKEFSGGEDYVSFTFSVAPGEYYIRVYQTAPDNLPEYWGRMDLGDISESQTFNFYRNTLYLSRFIIEPNNPNVGDTVTIKAEIVNPSNQDLRGGIASIYVDRDKQSPYDFSEGIVYDTIPAGGSKIITLGSFTVTEPGKYYVKYEVATQTTESDIGTTMTDHGLGWGELFTATSNYPDLNVISVKLYKNGQEISEAYPGDQIEVKVTVKNLGNASSSSTSVGLYLSKIPYDHSSSDFIDDISVPGLSPGQETTVTKTITIPDKSPDEYYLNAYVDYKEQITESEERNNIGYATININPKPPSIESVEIGYYGENSYHSGPVFKVVVHLQGDTNQIKKVTLWWDDKNDINPFPESIDFTRVNEYYYEGILNLTGHEGHDIGYHIEVELNNGSKLVFPRGWSGGSDDAYIHLWVPIELSNIEIVIPPDRESREFITGETMYVTVSLRNRLDVPISENLDTYLNLGLVHIATKQGLVLDATSISLNPNEKKTITIPVTIPPDEWIDVANQYHPVLPGLHGFGAILIIRDIEVGDNIRFRGNLISGVGTLAVFTGNSTIAHYYPSTVSVLSSQDSLVMIDKLGVSYIEQIDDIAFHLHLDKHAGVYAVDSALKVANTLNTAMEFVDAVKTTGELIEHLTDPNARKLLADVIGLASNDFIQGIVSGKISPDEEIGDETSYDMTIVKGGLLGSSGALLFHETTPVEVTKAGWKKAQEFFWDATARAAIAVLTDSPLSAVMPYAKEILDESASYSAIYSKLEEAQITYTQYRPEYFEYPIHTVDMFKDGGGDYIGYIYGVQFQEGTYKAGDNFVLTFEGTTNGFSQNLQECQGSCPYASSFGLVANIYLESSSGNRILIYKQPQWPDASPSACTLRVPIGYTESTSVSINVPLDISSGYYKIVVEATEGYHTNQLGIPYEDQMFIGVKTKTLISSRKIYIDAPPTVSFISPQPSQHIAQGDTLQIEINATDAEGVSYVELYLDGNLIKNWTSGPYIHTFNTQSLSVGQHTLKAVAVDTAGQESETSLTFYVDQPEIDNPPTIEITNKAQLTSKTWVMGEDIVVKVSAGDDKGITKIECYVNNQKIGTYPFNGDTTVKGSVSIPQNSLVVGENTIAVKVYDTSGQNGEDQVTIQVKADEPPTVIIHSPANGTRIERGQILMINAEIQDDLDLSKIQLLVDGEALIDDISNPSNPYTYMKSINTSSWSLGTHTLQLIAYDTSNQRTTVTIQIEIINPPIPGDINNDGEINSLDALLYLRFIVGLDTSPYIIDPTRDDITGDGKITIADALKVLRIAVGLENPI